MKLAKLAALICLTTLGGCVHFMSRSSSVGIPVTFEVYSWRSDADLPLESRPYDVEHISRLMRGRCIFRYDFDARSGVPVSLIRERRRDYMLRRRSLPSDGYMLDHRLLEAVVLPDFYQRCGYLEYYLVRFDAQNRISQVISSKSGRLLPDRELLSRCSPGDKIIAEWSF